MKKLVTLFSLFFITSCFFNFEQNIKSTTFYNFCKNDIKLNIEKKGQSHISIIKSGKNSFFYGSNKEDRFSYVSNGKKYSFVLYKDSSENNQIYIACPENASQQVMATGLKSTN